MVDKIKFKLREDMPIGFKQNANYPELPAMFSYLTPHNGKEYNNTAEFQEVLDGFIPYLNENHVPKGGDKFLREGLFIKRLHPRFEEMNWDYEVFTIASNLPGKCVFGGLEIIATEDIEIKPNKDIQIEIPPN